MGTDDLYKAVYTLIDDDKPSVSRGIFIGAGDDGIKTLYSAKKILEKRIHPEARRYVRWIAVNGTESGRGSGFEKEGYRLPPGRFNREESNILCLSMPGTPDMSKDFLRAKYKNDLCFDWLPDPDIYDFIDTEPHRAHHRFNFFLNEDNIRRSLIRERDILDQLPDEPRYFRLACAREAPGKKKNRISVFIAVSPSCTAGSGIFFDIAAMVKDIFRNTWPGPDIYAVLIFTGHENRNDESIADAYAFMKELDYFMSGGKFMSVYPSGRRVEIHDSLFENGKVYMLEPVNMAGKFLDESACVYDLAGEMVSAVISGYAGGPVDYGRIHRNGVPAYHFFSGDTVRKACYSSFGLSRAVYPVPELIEAGYRSVAVKIIESFFTPVTAGLLAETLGSMSRGLFRQLKFNCRMIFEKMHPGHKADIDNEAASIRSRFVSSDGDIGKDRVMSAMKNVITGYSCESLERLRHLRLSVMERRYRPELARIRNIIHLKSSEYIGMPDKGFLFAEMILDILRERLDEYIKKYRAERSSIAMYSVSDMEEFMIEQDKSEIPDNGLTEALCSMACFNYSQSVYESMLASAEAFAVEFRGLIATVKNSMLAPLHKKACVLKKNLEREISIIKSDLFKEKNPFLNYLVTESEMDLFIEKHLFKKLAIEDLYADLNINSFFIIDDEPSAIMGSYLLSEHGLEVLSMGQSEICDIISAEYGDCSDKSSDEIISTLYSDKGVDDNAISGDCAFTGFEIDDMKRKLFRVIQSRLGGHGFADLSIKDILNDRKITPDVLLEQLDVSSRPYISPDLTLTGPVEYYRVTAGFKLDADDQGGDTLKGNVNDLPPRVKDSGKRMNSEFPVLAEIIESPVICGGFEIVSTGILTGIPLAGLLSVGNMAEVYHISVSDRRRPLHIFNGSSCNALYFPDPAGKLNYLDPVKLWSGLVLLNILEEKDGVYSYTPELVPVLKDIEARENYRKVILELYKKIEQQSGADNIQPELLAEVVSGLGILAKNPSDGKLQFRRDYLPVILEIMDSRNDINHEPGPRRDIVIPDFSSSMELVNFLEGDSRIKSFVTDMIKSVIERSVRNITAAADITLPSKKTGQTALPVFRNKFEFYDYFEKRGSLEWQHVLMKALSEKLDMYISSSKFRSNDGSGQPDRSKVSELLKALELRIPEAVLMEADMKNRA